MRELPDRSVFTHRHASDVGWSPAALKHAVDTGTLIRLRRGIYTNVTLPDPRHMAVAASLAFPYATVSHRSAALLHGLPVIGASPAVPEVTVAPRKNGNLTGVHVHRAGLRPDEVVRIDGARVTSAQRTVIDMARTCPLSVAVSAIDAALHRRLTSSELLDQTLLGCWNWPGIGRAQRAVRLVDGRAESPLESISRLTIRWLGLPPPTTQSILLANDNRFLGRTDFYWDEFGVVGEADGRSKYDARPVLTGEKERQEALEDTGLVVVRWGWRHVSHHPNDLRSKLDRAFERGRHRDRSGFPRLWRVATTDNHAG